MEKRKIDYSLYLVVGKENVKDNNFCESIEMAINGGCSIIQLREKTSNSHDFYELAVMTKKITEKYSVPLIINDRIDIALAVDAEGVHLGQSDMPAAVARKIIGENKILGISASTLIEAKKAEKEGADYLGIGAMFPTGTKNDAKITSLDELKKIRSEIKLPLVIIGGINEETIPLFSGTGIDGIAVVTAILSKPDIKKATLELKEMFREI